MLTAPTRLKGYGGAVRDARSLRGMRLGFGGKEVPGERIGATDLSMRSRMAGVEVSGYLGLDLWNGSRVVLDTRTQMVRIEPASPRVRKRNASAP